MSDQPQPTTRDTQFKGFARNLFAELNGLHDIWLERQTELYYEKIIARRAYDLLLHAAHSTALLDTWEESKAKVALVSDMTTFPPEQEEE